MKFNKVAFLAVQLSWEADISLKQYTALAFGVPLPSWSLLCVCVNSCDICIPLGKLIFLDRCVKGLLWSLLQMSKFELKEKWMDKYTIYFMFLKWNLGFLVCVFIVVTINFIELTNWTVFECSSVVSITFIMCATITTVSKTFSSPQTEMLYH